jgi:hypothetical protein
MFSLTAHEIAIKMLYSILFRRELEDAAKEVADRASGLANV